MVACRGQRIKSGHTPHCRHYHILAPGFVICLPCQENPEQKWHFVRVEREWFAIHPTFWVSDDIEAVNRTHRVREITVVLLLMRLLDKEGRDATNFDNILLQHAYPSTAPGTADCPGHGTRSRLVTKLCFALSVTANVSNLSLFPRDSDTIINSTRNVDFEPIVRQELLRRVSTLRI